MGIWYAEKMKLDSLIAKIRRKIIRFRLKPIRVYCFHQVSDTFEADTMKECDWMRTEDFKRTILALKMHSTFISLTEVKSRLENDFLRTKRFVALTADDGWASLKNVLSWLAEQNVPVTLFLNPCYLDGEHFRERDTEKYLTLEDVENFAVSYKNVSVALHGWEHRDVSVLSESEFRDDVEKSMRAIKELSCIAHFYAYPWGKHSEKNDTILGEYGFIPVLMDGVKNYSDSMVIHRESLTV